MENPFRLGGKLNQFDDELFFFSCVIYLIIRFFWLQAISACSSEVPSVLEFLQHRKLEASKVKAFLTF